MKKPYTDIHLQKYADVFVNFALDVQPNKSVLLNVPESASDLLPFLYESVLKAGAHPIVNFRPEGLSNKFFAIANDKQLEFFPEKTMLSRLEETDYLISIIADSDPTELSDVDPKKLALRRKASGFYSQAYKNKMDITPNFWTLGMFGTQGMADLAGLSLDEYWEQIIEACFLNEDDPKACFEDIFSQIANVKKWLNSLDIDYMHIQAEDIDLTVGLGENRQWLGGSGRNIPSFEVFISPDWRTLNGKIAFTEPLLYQGSILTGIELEFVDGKVSNFKADKGQEILTEIFAVENADKVGEFSLTDKKFSRIQKFMAQTLYDENVGGEFGNTHIAIGSAYTDSCTLDGPMSEEQKLELGFNQSIIHIDIVSTKDRTVTATLKDGRKVVIYKNGEFTLDE